MIIDLEETFVVGQDSFFESISRSSSFGVTFEDDLTTGYFYAINTEPDLVILDALHVYDVDNVIDKEIPSQIKIAWNDEMSIAFLILNNYCHAIFDFKTKAGYCRNGFPKSNGEWCLKEERLLTNDLYDELINSNK